ncbi:phosphate ABC transporter phosphate-binding protein [Acetonema longum DSM 6540]|uniref:Phosphate-binding protein n=1 Tax=Acetonema longum DSM 6540 TaxID=1009370 RepID=F7NH76_9FIRM|nr:phosphate ABC transporter substrate-binding protein [Acetonema longum]EGO64559.1 phosphate ABC transporter phosphate-binding protein [Acetonema longum DSM 6540]
MFNFKRIAALVAMVAVSASLLAGCGGAKNEGQNSGEIKGTVTASGSTALLPLLKAAQEEFQKANANVTVNIAGGGSFTGQNQVASGAVNIGNSDVALDAQLKDKGLVEHKLVVIPFVFITHPDVSVNSLTTEQAASILSGKITNWKEVGGQDQKITIMSRSKSSGSRATIAEVVLKNAAFTDNVVIQDSNGALRTAVASTPGAIGYVDAAYVDKTVKELTYNGVKYSVDNVVSGKYGIYTYGRMFTKGAPTGAVKAFIDYATSKDFQEKYAEKNGFVPSTKMPK